MDEAQSGVDAMKYEVTFHVLREQLNTVLSVISSEVTLVSLKAIEEVEKPKHTRKAKVGPRRNGALTLKELVTKMFNDKPTWTDEQIKGEFKSHGFAKTSLSPMLAAERRAGNVRWDSAKRVWVKQGVLEDLQAAIKAKTVLTEDEVIERFRAKRANLREQK
jgi:hypothetical protein